MVEQDVPALFNPDSLTPADQKILGFMEKAITSIEISLEPLKCADCGCTVAMFPKYPKKQNMGNYMDEIPFFCLPYPCAYNWSKKQPNRVAKGRARKTATVETHNSGNGGPRSVLREKNETSADANSVIQEKRHTESNGTQAASREGANSSEPESKKARREIGPGLNKYTNILLAGPTSPSVKSPLSLEINPIFTRFVQSPVVASENMRSSSNSSGSDSSKSDSSSSDSSRSDRTRSECNSSDSTSDDDRPLLTRDLLPNFAHRSLPWKERCKTVLSLLWNSADSHRFRCPVDLQEHPDYNQVISRPMCLRTIRENLATDKYTSPVAFHEDVMLIFENSLTYNTDPDTQIHLMGLTFRLQRLYEEKFKRILGDLGDGHGVEMRTRNEECHSDSEKENCGKETDTKNSASDSFSGPENV